MNTVTHILSDLARRQVGRFLSFGVLFILVACGGGGGNSSSSGSSGGTASASPSLSLSIVDASGNTVVSNAVSRGAAYYASALVKDASGSPVGNKLVTFSTNSSIAALSQATGLTNATTGVARVQISPSSLTSAVGTLTASATVGTSTVTSSLDYQTTAGNVSLSALTVGSSTLSALQTTAVTVQATVGGSAATSGLVSVNFSATCGAFSPATAATDGTGKVSTVYQPDASCSGTVTLTATDTTSSASSLSTAVTVSAITATNVVFDSATPSSMVTSLAPSGIKQSTVKFRVLNAAGGMSGQTLTITLSSAAINAGVTFLGGSTSAQTVTTDSSGYGSVIVISGTLPTPVGVSAALGSTGLNASSSGVTVTSGVPAQSSASIAASKVSIEGLDVDGVTTTITWRIADRQGNPIAPGAVVNFVTRSNSQVVGSCALDSTSSCSVTFTSQGLRPNAPQSLRRGRAAVVAYMDGEESFLDLNGNNKWDAGETFYDVGTLYLDEDEDYAYDASTEQSYPGGSVGSSACASVTYSHPSISNTCDGTWSSSIRVRQQMVIVLAGSTATITMVDSKSVNGFTVRIQDENQSSMPAGTTVSAAVTTPGSACTVSSVAASSVSNSQSGPSTHKVTLNGDASCATAKVDVTVTTPSGRATPATF